MSDKSTSSIVFTGDIGFDRFMMLNTGAMSLDGFIAADRQIEDESVAGRQKAAAAAEQETV